MKKSPSKNNFQFNIILHNLSDNDYRYITPKLQQPQLVILNERFVKEGLDIAEMHNVVNDSIFEYIKTNKLCIQEIRHDKSGINDDYVFDSLENSNATIFFSENPDDIFSNILGFATLNFEKNMKRLHIEIICTKKESGFGSILMNKLKEIAGYLYMDEIFLLSIEGALGYYFKNQFQCAGEDGLCEMIFKLKRERISKSIKKGSAILMSKKNKTAKKSR